MTITEKRAKQRRIHQILLDNSELDVLHNCINNTLDYEGVDISDPLITVYDYFMTRLRVACGLPVVQKVDKYNYIRDKKPRVYISGKITGLSEEEYKNNFNSAELYLTSLGYNVVNPVAYDTIPNGTWTDYMKRDIRLLMGCDYIYMLDNWTESTGAKTEYRLAVELGIECLKLDEK